MLIIVKTLHNRHNFFHQYDKIFIINHKSYNYLLTIPNNCIIMSASIGLYRLLKDKGHTSDLALIKIEISERSPDMDSLFNIGLILCYLFLYCSVFYIQTFYIQTRCSGITYKLLLLAVTNLALDIITGTITSGCSPVII